MFFLNNSRKFATSPSRDAICCTKNYQSIVVTVHSHCVERRFEGLLQRCRRGRGGKLSRIREKNTIFNEHPELWKNTIFPSFRLCIGCLGKSGVFHNSLQPPSFAYIAVRDLQSSQRNASVQSLLLAVNFCTINSCRVLARERWQIFWRILDKKQYLMNTL